MKTIKCESCGAELDKPTKNCPQCGAKLKAARNLVECRVCGEYVAKNAKKCPSCGAKNPSKAQHKASIACSIVVAVTLILIVAVVAGAIGGSETTSTSGTSNPEASASAPKQSDAPDYIVADAEDLWKAYDENEVNADNIYKGNFVALTGTISNIGTDAFSGAPCVSLESGDEFGLYPIQCFFPKNGSETDAIAALADGDTVTIYGKCTGKAVLYVQLTGCSLSGE